MATNDVNIGKGRASGMFLTATSGTALPTTLSETTLGSWGRGGRDDQNRVQL